jgi:basic amino acid/polyamine antiporter, APA family
MGTNNELRRQLGLASATALIVGEVIGIGIFLTPTNMAVALASPFWILIVWLVMGAMTLCGALCYGELAARYPEAGGPYVYLREAFGLPMAFLYGWISVFVIDPGISAALAVGLVPNVVIFLPKNLANSPIFGQAVGVTAIVILAAVNCLGIRIGDGVLRTLTVAKLGLLAFIVVFGFASSQGDWNNFVPFVERPADAITLFGALAAGMMSAFFSYGGWWDLSKAAGDVRDPARTLPRAYMLGVAVVSVVFVSVSAVFLYLVPLKQITGGKAFAELAGTALFGDAGGKVFSAIVILVVLGSLCSILMAQPRVYFAMARDGLFVPGLARINPRLGTPVRAIALEAVLASALVILGVNFDTILGYFLFAAVLLIALSVAALFVLRRHAVPKSPADAITVSPGTTPISAGAIPPASNVPAAGYPWTAGFYLMMSALLLALMGAKNPAGAAIGVGAVVLGLVTYRLLPSTRQSSH